MVAWPRSSWIARRSAPPSSRWVANECRSACGWARASAGERATARLAQPRSRRLTSEVDSRRPDLERNSARVAARPSAASGPAAGQVALERLPGVLADRDEPGLAALALDAHRLGVEVERLEVERDELLGAQPAGVGQLEQRPVAQLERRRRPGSSRAAPRPRRVFSTRGRRCGRLGELQQLGRVVARARRPRSGSGTARAARPAGARWSPARSRARTGRRRSGGASGRRSSAGSAPRSSPRPRTAARRSAYASRVFSATARRRRSSSNAVERRRPRRAVAAGD